MTKSERPQVQTDHTLTIGGRFGGHLGYQIKPIFELRH